MIVMENPLVSIVIPVYNGANFLKEAIESALNQTYKNIEIIVINDGSTDQKTEQIALAYQEKIRYYYKSNGGVATALNYGIQKMKGEYFSWLSHDDIYYPNKIEKQIHSINNTKDKRQIVYSGCDILYEKNQSKISVLHEDKYSKNNLENSIFPVLFGLVNGCSLLIHKSHFERVGGFNEHLLTTQDYDLWFRMFRGQRLVYINEPLVISRQHDQQGSKTIREYTIERGNLYINMIESLSTNEINEIYRKPFNFYFKMGVFFDTRQMIEARDYIYDKLNNMDDLHLQNDSCNFIESFTRYSSRHISKICLFGMGIFGKQLFEELMCRMVPIDSFIDNDEKKWGSQYKGVECISIEDVIKESNDDVLIIVSMMNPSDTIRQLEKYKCKNVITMQSMEEELLATDPVPWLVKKRIQMHSIEEYQLVNHYNKTIFEMLQNK